MGHDTIMRPGFHSKFNASIAQAKESIQNAEKFIFITTRIKIIL